MAEEPVVVSSKMDLTYPFLMAEEIKDIFA